MSELAAQAYDKQTNIGYIIVIYFVYSIKIKLFFIIPKSIPGALQSMVVNLLLHIKDIGENNENDYDYI